jgi:hypothetical protein
MIFDKKKVTAHKMCVLILSTTSSETFLILRNVYRVAQKNVYTLHPYIDE